MSQQIDRRLATVTAVVLAGAYVMVFFYAPIEADQGFVQKIFYLHVPLAIVTLCGFIAGGVQAGLYLRTGRRAWDMRSYVAIHMSLIFGVGGIVTGSIWARASWGHWWVWQEPTLVSYLIVLLLFCAYQPLRFAIEDPERQSRYAAVFALTAGAFVPVNFVAVRMATAYVHPRVFQFSDGAQLPPAMGYTFLAALIAIALLFVTMCRFEIRAKSVSMRLRRLERMAGSQSSRPGLGARVYAPAEGEPEPEAGRPERQPNPSSTPPIRTPEPVRSR